MGNRRIAELVSEFVPLNRRRVQGNPPLSVADLERWSELRNHLALEFGHTPPDGRVRQPRHLRVPTHLKVRYRGRGEHAATLENLSEGGLFVRCAEPLAPDTPLRLEIELESEGGEVPLRLEAVVVHTREADDGNGPAGFGAEFRNVEAEEQAALAALVEGVLASVAEA